MNSFYEVMQKHPDSKLLEIVEKKRKDYQPEALAAAEQVLNERNIAFTIPEEKKADPVKINVEAEIRKRMEKGQNLNSIKAELKDIGIDPLQLAQKKENVAAVSEATKGNMNRIIGVAGVIGVVIGGVMLMQAAAKDGGALLVFSIVGFLGGLVGFVYLAMKK